MTSAAFLTTQNNQLLRRCYHLGPCTGPISQNLLWELLFLLLYPQGSPTATSPGTLSITYHFSGLRLSLKTGRATGCRFLPFPWASCSKRIPQATAQESMATCLKGEGRITRERRNRNEYFNILSQDYFMYLFLLVMIALVRSDSKKNQHLLFLLMFLFHKHLHSRYHISVLLRTIYKYQFIQFH